MVRMPTGPQGKLWWFNRKKLLNIPTITIKQLLEAGVHLGHEELLNGTQE